MTAFPLLLQLLAQRAQDGTGLMGPPAPGSDIPDFLSPAGGDSGLPEPPVYGAPAPYVPERPGFLDRLATATASAPGYTPRPYESALSAGVRGAVAGLERGFGQSRLLDMGRREKAGEAQAAADKTAADRNYQNKLATWQLRMKKYMDEEGNVLVGNELINRYPSLALYKGARLPVGTLMDKTMQMDAREPMVPIPNEPALATYMGRKVGDMVKQSELLAARSGMKPSGSSGAGANMGGADFNPQAIAQGIVTGRIPADPAGYSRGQWGVIASFLPADFDLNKAMTDSRANRTFTATLNGRQFVMLRAAQQGVLDALKPLRDANDNVRRVAGLSSSPDLNKPLVWWKKQFNSKERAAIVERSNKAALVVEPLASVLRNGGMPTDQAQQLAEQIVSTNDAMPPDMLETQIRGALEGLGLREEAFNAASPRTVVGGSIPRGPATDPWSKYRKGGGNR